MFDLTVVIPTCDRPTLLESALRSLASVACRTEVIVVDASSDGASAVVVDRHKSDGLVYLREPGREGFVRAANKGFRIARGRCLTWLNDDARALPGSLEAAVTQVDAGAAFVAMYHRWGSPRNIALEQTHLGRAYQLCHVRGTLYANFGVGLRTTFDRLGYFDERYYFYAADPDFSLKVWASGMAVVPAEMSFVDHDEHADDRRATDNPRGRLDNEALFAKWPLPARNPDRNDFDPARPCTLAPRWRRVEDSCETGEAA